MTAAGRILMVIVVGGTLLMAATVATAAVAIYGSGTIEVSVEETRGDRFSVRVPAGIANVALTLIPAAAYDEALREVEDELKPVIPAVRDAWDQLQSTGDFVLVRVDDGRGGHVIVEKIDEHLRVSFHDEHTDVDVAVPMKTLGKIIHKL